MRRSITTGAVKRFRADLAANHSPKAATSVRPNRWERNSQAQSVSTSRSEASPTALPSSRNDSVCCWAKELRVLDLGEGFGLALAEVIPGALVGGHAIPPAQRGLHRSFAGIVLPRLAGPGTWGPFGGLTQMLTTVIGQEYRLSFSLGTQQSAPFCEGPISVDATAGGTTLPFTSTPAAPIHNGVSLASILLLRALALPSPLLEHLRQAVLTLVWIVCP